MADRYWVGGTASWDATAGTKWATTSGGAGGAAVPTSADDVFINAASGAVTITMGAASPCRNLNFTGFTGTFTGTFNLNIYGSLTLASTMTYSYTGVSPTFAATTTGHTITLAGKTTSSAWNFTGVGGGWTVQDAWTNNSSYTITHTAGTLNLNGQTLTCGTFSTSGTTTRTLTTGNAAINCGTWQAGTTTGLTLNLGTSTITCNSSSTSGVIIFGGGGLTYNSVVLAPTGAGLFQIQGANTFSSLTITGAAAPLQEFNLTANQTVTGTFTATGNNVSPNRLFIYSQPHAAGTQITISAATTSLTNVDFRYINGTGGGAWSGTSVGNALGNSGITFTTPVTRYGVAAGNWSSTASWSASSGGSAGASAPICHDTVILNASSGAGTYTIDSIRSAASIDCTGFTGALSTSNFIVFGSLTLNSTMTTPESAGYMRFWGTGTHTFTTGNQSFFKSTVEFNSVAGSYTLSGSYTNTSGGSTITLISGTLDAGSSSITGHIFSSSLSTDIVRSLILGSSTWTLTNSGTSTLWNCGTANNANLTITPGTSTIILNATDAFTKTFAGGGKSYNVVRFSGTSTNPVVISGNNTFETLENTRAVAYTIQFTTGSNQSIRNWSISGTEGNLISIDSTTTGTHTLTKIGGGVVSANYLDIQHSLARPGAWYAGLNSTNDQGVATAGNGWIFNVPPIPNKKTSTNFAPRRAHNY